MNMNHAFSNSTNLYTQSNGTDLKLNGPGLRRRCGIDTECEQCSAVEETLSASYASTQERIGTTTMDDFAAGSVSSDFNIWRTCSRPDYYESRNTCQDQPGPRKWRCELRTVYGNANHGVVIKVHSFGSNKTAALEDAFYQYMFVVRRFFTIRNQMDTLQGDVTQSSVMENNTIITEDTSVEKSLSFAGQGPRLQLVSTEETHDFSTIMNRWMPFQSYQLSTSQTIGTEIFFNTLPESFYSDNVTPNLTQFRNFIFGEFDIEIRIIINAHRFQCGKLIACVFPDPYQGLSTRRTFQNALQLPHVIIDLNGNNHGVLEVPFKYRRPFMRLVSDPNSNKGVRAGVYGAIGAYILSPMRTGADQSQTCQMRTFFRFKRNNLAGMSYQVTVQMDDIKGICEGVGMTVKGIEKTLVRAGHLINWDKPQDVVNIIQTVPRPRLNFFTGKGLSDALQMRMSPYTTDVLPPQLFRPNDPQTVHDIARIWGYENIFQLNATDQEGVIAYTWVVDPASSSQNFPYDATGTGVPSPFTFINGMYNLWSGPIELRFDFVSNDFITGTVQVAFEPGRMSSTELQAQSTYTKTFHLGEQRTLTFTIPYINDNVYRRTGIQSYNENLTDNGASVSQSNARGMRMVSINSITMRVINPIRCVATTTQSIDVLVFMRAGENYVNMSPVMSSWSVNKDTANTALPQFPGSFATSVAVSNTVASVNDIYQEVGYSFKSLKVATPSTSNKSTTAPAMLRSTADGKYVDLKGKETAYKSPAARIYPQMDNGDKEATDSTHDFSQGPNRNDQFVTDRHDNILDILRRPVQLWSRVSFPGNSAYNTVGNFNAFYVPVMPPGPMWLPSPATGNNDNFLTSINKTPQACLVSCFRHWRGSLRFTFLFQETTNPVYISYMPHNGILNWGLVARVRGGTDRSTFNVGPHSCGLTTEIVIPAVNPTVTIEVPYENEFDYMLTSEEDRSRNYAWREKNGYNNGHLIVWSQDMTATMDVWVAAGDSFYLCDYIGTYVTTNKLNPAGPSDNNPTVTSVVAAAAPAAAAASAPPPPPPPADFRQRVQRNNPADRYRTNPTYTVRQQMDSPSTSYYQKLGSVIDNVITSPTTTRIVENRAFLPTASVVGAVTGLPLRDLAIGLKAEKAFASARVQYDSVISVVKQTVMDMAQRLGSTLDITNIMTIVTEISIDIIMLIRNFDLVSAVLTGIKLVGKLLGNYTTILSDALGRITAWVSGRSTSNPHEQISGLEGDHSLIALMAGIMGTLFRVSFHSSDITGWAKEFALVLTSSTGLNYFNSTFIFMRNYYDLLSAMVKKAMGLSDPYSISVESLQRFLPAINQLMSDIDVYTSPLNKSQRSLSMYRYKYWAIYMSTMSLKAKLLVLPKNQQASNILRQCDKMIKHADENFAQLTNIPIRYVPFLICLEGKPNIGKTHLVEDLGTAVFEALNITSFTGSDVHVRNPRAKHWDGLDGQKIIHMDDVFNLTDSESLLTTISDMYALKTPALFVPEKASLEDKGKTENPVCVVQTTNTPFPRSCLDNIAANVEAIYRRRDLVVKVNYVLDVPPGDADPAILRNNEHLTFQVYENSCDDRSLSETVLNWQEFRQMFVDTVRGYDVREKRSVQHRLREALNRMGTRAELMDPSIDPFKFSRDVADGVYADQEEGVFLPSELVAQALPRIKQILDEAALVPLHFEGEVQAQIFGLPSLTGIPWKSLLVAAGAGLAAGAGVEMYNRYAHNADYGTCRLCTHANRRFLRCSKGHTACYQCSGDECNFAVDGVVCGETQFYEDVTVMMNMIDKARELIATGTEQAWQGALKLTDTLLRICGWRDGHLFHMLCRYGLLWGVSFYMDSRKISPYIVVDGRKYMVQTQGDPLMYTGRPPCAFRSMEKDPEDILRVFGITYDSARMQTWFNAMQERPAGWFSKDVNAMSATQQCVHTPLLMYGDYVEYADGAWKIFTPQGEISIPDDKDSCYKCQLTLEQYGSMCANFWGNSKAVFVRHIRMNQMKVDTVEAMVPPFMISRKWDVDQLIPDGYYNTPMMKCFKALGVIVTTLATVYGLYKTTAWMFGNEIQGQIESSGDPVTRHFQRKKEKPVVQRLKEQGDSLEEIIIGKIVSNSACLEVTYDGGETIKLAMSGIMERVALLPKHYVGKLKQDEHIIDHVRVGRCEDPTSFTDYALDFKDFEVSDISDIAIFHMPQTQMMFKNIVKFMQQESDLSLPMTAVGTMVRMPSTKVHNFMIVPLKFKGFKKQVLVDGLCQFHQSDALYYNYSSDGACGSLVLKSASQRPICAMHFAGAGEGHNGTGYAILVTQEMVSDIVPRTKVKARRIPVVAPASDSTLLMPPHVQVDYVGVAPDAVYMPEKSKIIPSMIQPEMSRHYGTLTLPCHLSRRSVGYQHEHSPLVAGCMKHGYLTKDFKTSDLLIAQEYIYDRYMEPMRVPLLDAKVLTLEQAILGFEGIVGYEPMKLDTSIGYPLNVQGVVSKREDIEVTHHDDGTKSVVVSDRLMKLYNDDMRLRRQGIVPETVFTAFLKDERKNLAKREKFGSTRIFLMSSAQYTIAKRQYYMHWTAAQKAHRQDFYSAVGINADSDEWTDLVNNLMTVGENIFTLDYSNFGPAFNAGVNFRCHENVIRWLKENVDMGEHADEILDCFTEEHVNSLHVMRNLMYRQRCGGPSGDPCTVNHNGDVNAMYVVLAWMDIYAAQGLPLGSMWNEFEENVYFKVYGDDLIASVSNKWRDIFNAKTISEFFSTKGIVATDASKAATIAAYGPLSEATFLKRGFLPHPVHQREWLAPLDQNSLTEICQWIHKSENDAMATIEVATASIRAAYAHGKEFYSQHKQRINNALKSVDLAPVPLAWEQIDRDCFPRYYGKARI